MGKEFKTHIVASAATGIAVGRETDFLTYSMLQEFYSHVMGYPIWTHEMGTGPIMSLAKLKIRELYPSLPFRDFCAENPHEAAEIAIGIYGETIRVPEGKETRPADPIETLRQMRSGPVVVTPDKDQ